MAILINYGVDKELYENPETPHNITLITMEYFYKNEVLVHLQIGKNLGIRFNNLIRYEFKQEEVLQNEQFLYKKAYDKGNAEAITQQIFEKKYKRFDISKTTVEREILHEYRYTGKNGNTDIVQIAVILKVDNITAFIEFKDAKQYENFIGPAWLVNLA